MLPHYETTAAIIRRRSGHPSGQSAFSGPTFLIGNLQALHFIAEIAKGVFP